MAQRLLIPVKKTKRLDGRFSWGEMPVLISPFAEDALPLAQLAKTLKTELGCRPRRGRNPLKAHTLLVRRSNNIEDLEGYELTIDRKKIEVVARTPAGAYYAMQTLRELVRVHGARMACRKIEDSPDFWRRGVYMDCSRGKVPTVDTVKLLVEYLASVKLNELQLYVENVFTFKSHPDIGRGFSPFTPEDMLAIQDHCKLHHIRFVPSLTSFGHFEKILGLPAYQHLGELPGHNGHVAGTTLYPADPDSIQLVADMYGDFLPLFEAEDFNVCGDEPWELGQGRSKKRAATVGKGVVYLDFIKKIHKLCEKHGKRMNLWSDIVLNHPEVIPDIPSDVVMLNWDYDAKGSRIPRTHEFVDAGLDVVICPGTNSWQSHCTRLSDAIANVSKFAQVGRKYNVLGMLNTDWGDGGHRNMLGVSFHGYAHGAAHSWHGRGVDDKRFTETFCFHVLKTEDAAVSGLMRTAGAVEDTVQERPYHILSEAIDIEDRYGKSVPRISPIWHDKSKLDKASPEGCRKVIAELKGADGVARKVVSKNPVARVVIEDLLVGVHLDRLMCRKALVAHQYRSGHKVPVRTLEKLAVDIGECALEFTKNWLKRNKVSRLKDNISLFKDNVVELAELGSK